MMIPETESTRRQSQSNAMSRKGEGSYNQMQCQGKGQFVGKIESINSMFRHKMHSTCKPIWSTKQMMRKIRRTGCSESHLESNLEMMIIGKNKRETKGVAFKETLQRSFIDLVLFPSLLVYSSRLIKSFLYNRIENKWSKRAPLYFNVNFMPNSLSDIIDLSVMILLHFLITASFSSRVGQINVKLIPHLNHVRMSTLFSNIIHHHEHTHGKKKDDTFFHHHPPFSSSSSFAITLRVWSQTVTLQRNRHSLHPSLASEVSSVFHTSSKDYTSLAHKSRDT